MPETKSGSPQLRPFWGRILVEQSAIEEHERHGVIVPSTYEGDEGVRRGIVLSIDPWKAEPTEAAVDLSPGMVVWYRGGTKVLDYVVLERGDILAVEVD